MRLSRSDDRLIVERPCPHSLARTDMVDSLLLLGLHREPGLNPSVESTLERMHIREATLCKQLRHTGARGFLGSSAIGDDKRIVGHVADISGLVYRDSQRARELRPGFCPCLGVAAIDELDLFAFL